MDTNYFSQTPVYKIWCDLIEYLSPRTSFIIKNYNYIFSYLECVREQVKERYSCDENYLEVVYAYENRVFFCMKMDKNNNILNDWKTPKKKASCSFNNFPIDFR